MSRMTTPSITPAHPQHKVPHEKIAQRAYEKWVKRGRPHGTSEHDWLEAEAELRSEAMQGNSGSSQLPRR